MKAALYALAVAAVAMAAAAGPQARGETPASPITLAVKPLHLGNIFAPGVKAAVEFDMKDSTPQDLMAWRLYDFGGAEVAHGEARFLNGSALVEPPLPHLGYFDLRVAVDRGGRPIAEARTSLGVLAPPPSRPSSFESHFGVMTHFAQGWDTDIMPLIARAGIRQIRDEQYWQLIEESPGHYAFPDLLRRYMADAAALGLQPLVPLTFSNKLYDGGQTPFSDPAVKAYARYALAVLRQYGSEIHAVEIWNEFNGSFATGPAAEDRPAAYARLLKQAYAAIKAERPDVTVVGGVVVLVPIPYLEKLFEHGALDSMDVLSIHPYREFPEGVEYDMADLRALMARFDHGKPKPIWATEIGTQDKTPGGRKNVARYMVRLSTILLSQGVQRIYWYLLRDYSAFATMGLLRGPDSPLGRYAPAPAYLAYANLIRQLDDATFVRRETTDPRTRIYLFKSGNQERRVAWTTDDLSGADTASTPVLFKAAQPLKIIDVDGRENWARPVDGEVSLRLSKMPVFIEGHVSAIRERRDDRVVTDSEAAFSATQGANGWSYGYVKPGAGEEGADFVPLSWLHDEWGYYWGDPSLPNLRVQRAATHPGQIGGHPVWSARRWKSTVDGGIKISGLLERPAAQGDGTEAQVRVDGRPIYTVDIGGPKHAKRVSFAVNASTHKGSVVEFDVSPGPAGSADLNSDATNFHVTITVPRK